MKLLYIKCYYLLVFCVYYWFVVFICCDCGVCVNCLGGIFSRLRDDDVRFFRVGIDDEFFEYCFCVDG